MAKTVKTFSVRQEFRAPPIVTGLFRAFPKFRGYWKFLELLSRVLPESQVLFDADVTLEDRQFRVPVDIRDPYQIDVFAKNKQELCVPALFSKLIGEGGFYFDVGANAGWYCRFMCLAVGESGIVVAMEPSDRAYAHLTKLRYDNLMPLPFAATDVNGRILRDASSPLRQSASSTFVPDGAGKNHASVRDGYAVGRSLDHLLAEFKRRPDILKVDVEGAELQVLRGGVKSLAEIKHVLIEVNPDDRCAKFGYGFREIYHLMSGLGFAHRYLVKNADNTVSRLDESELIEGDILFSRSAVCE